MVNLVISAAPIKHVKNIGHAPRHEGHAAMLRRQVREVQVEFLHVFFFRNSSPRQAIHLLSAISGDTDGKEFCHCLDRSEYADKAPKV